MAYRRIPWSARSGATAAEEIPLIESGSSSILEGVAAEETAFGTFVSIEEAGAALDATGVGAPVGIAIGILGALGYGTYEIYEHLKKHKPKVTLQKVQREYNKAAKNPDPHLKELDKRLQSYYDQHPTVEPLEHQRGDLNLMSLEDQKPSNSYYQTLPGSRYIGPGNPVDNGTPTNQVDFAAKQHDIAYTEAKSDQDVRVADQVFKESAQNSVAEALSIGGNPLEGLHGAVGYLGIQAKNLYEDTFNSGKSAYPTFSGKKWLLHISREIKFHLL